MELLTICNNSALLSFFSITKRILTLIQVIVPILLIVSCTIDITKLLKNPEEKNGVKKIINKFIATLIIFMIPVLLDTTMSLVGENTKLSSCWNHASYNSSSNYIETETGDKKKIITEEEYEQGDATTGTCLSKKKTTKILFVGNSKTYVKDIPGKFKNIAISNGYKVEVASVTEGGRTLEYLGNNYSSDIAKSSYDCVILQEQTDVYASNYNTYLSGAKKVTSLVRKNNSQTKAYIRALWILNNSSKSDLNTAYHSTEKIAQETSSSVIYDGKAFENCKASYPNISLYSDDRHQSEAGAYLSAATIYKALSGTSPEKTSYKAALDTDTANKLLKIAANT